MLSYWHESKLLIDNKVKSVKNQIIWNNQNIAVDGKSIFFRNWFNKGIVYFSDLLDEDSNFHSLAGLKEKFQINPPFTVYYSLLKAIPKEWKTALQNEPRPDRKAGLDSGLDSGLDFGLDSGLDFGLTFIDVK